jgi:hypothetical protein
MDASPASVAPSFLERVAWVLERVEHRCALTAQDKELVYRTRYTASSRQNLMQSRLGGRLFDEQFDNSANHYNIMTFLDDEFVSTFRIHVASGKNAILPSLTEFGDVLTPLLSEGRVVVDLTRIAAKLEYACKFPELPYLTIRAAWLAAEHFAADVIISTCFGEHQGFYSRVFGFESLCSPRVSPQISRTIACMALDFRAKKERVENRYPLFRSTEAERQSIYGPLGSLTANWRG